MLPNCNEAHNQYKVGQGCGRTELFKCISVITLEIREDGMHHFI